MVGITLSERLEAYAKEGHLFCFLNLYKRQIERLVIRDGLAVQRGNAVAGYKGQFRCQIGWKYALPGTTAYHLLELASQCNPEARKMLEIHNDLADEEPYAPPYESGWTV